jgi:hypothetical protein
LLNPNPFPITVNGAFLPEFGGAFEQTYQVPAQSRSTVYLNGAAGNIGGTGALFWSTSNFMAERSIYWGAGRVEGSNVVGATGPAHEWHFPEGVAHGDFETFLMMANFTATPSTARITLYVEGIGRFTMSELPVSLPVGSRKTIHMNTFLGQVEALEGLAPGTLRNRNFAYKVNVIQGAPIVAEQAIYRQRDGSNFWRSGSASFGIPR